MSTATTTIDELTPLKVADRCDTRDCSAQAKVRLWIEVGDELKPLDFCGHHYVRHTTPYINGVVITVEDQRE